MEKTKKRAKIWLCIGLALMLLSGIVVSLIQTGSGSIEMKELKIETDAGYAMSAYLFIPENATAETPAPAIVTSHGYLNNKEMQDANYVELARRGFVVLAIDQPAHGNSDNLVGSSNANGVYQGALALSRMPFVDVERIGITGHSMGGMSCNSAIAQDNAAETQIISAVLLNCADATYTDSDGAYANIYGGRDVGIMAAMYDEFFHAYVDEATGEILYAPYFLDGPNAQSFLNFGADPASAEKRVSDTVYYESIDGEEAMRVIYNPDIIHPWAHFSAKATNAVISFFTEALDAPNPIDASNQIWQWKEAFNLVGAVGLVIFVVCFGILMVFTPAFSSLRAKELVAPAPVKDGKGKAWFWCSLAVSAIFATVIYIPVLKWGTGMAVSQTETMGLGLWSTLCGLFTILSMAVYYFAYGKKNGFNLRDRGVTMPLKQFGKTIVLALIVVVVAYGCVFAVDYFFMSDFRIWTLAIKAFEVDKVWLTLTYMWLFLIYYVAASVSLNSFNYNTIGKKWWINDAIISLFATIPALILPWIQYITYYSQKHMMWPASNMHVLWLFPIVLILFGANFTSRYLYRVTKNPYISGIVNGVIVAIMTVTNTCTVFMA